MKKSLLFFVLLIGLISLHQANAITVMISGTVTNDSTGAPVANHLVYIYADSSSGFSFYATRTTNPNGYYDCNVQNVPGGIAIPFLVYTYDCNQVQHVDTAWSNNSPVTANFVICTENSSGCEAGFTHYADSLNPLKIYFLDSSTPQNLVTEWTWNFGDGSPVVTIHFPNNPNVSHIYPQNGSYLVCLTIHTSTGCTSVYCDTIQAGQGGGGVCEAYFISVADSTPNQNNIHFYDESSGNPIHWGWGFGDPSSGANNISALQNPQHLYASAGVYIVCLTIECSNNTTSTWCDTVLVGGNLQNCENSFNYSKNFLTVALEGHCNSQYPVVYTWHMGDPAGTVLTGQNVTFTYATAGQYTITLNTIDSTGCIDESHETIYVSATCDLWGYVVIVNSYADHGFVELYKADQGMITVIDTAEISDSAGMYHFGGVAPGHYYLKATLNSNSVYFGQYVPTYYTSSVNWANATMIELGQPNNPYNIQMVHVPGTNAGSGTIHGTINQSLKVGGGGSPAPNVEVLLLDGQNNPLTYTSTNASGQFTFANIALGSYVVYPEYAGKVTTPANITLDNMNSTANLNFSMQSGTIIFGIHDQYPSSITNVSEVYPNPPGAKANITIVSNKELNIRVEVLQMTGQTVQEISFTLHSGQNRVTLITTSLPQGFYYIRITTDDGGSVVRKFIIVR